MDEQRCYIKCIHVSGRTALLYNAVILNTMVNVFNLHDTEVDMCIILIMLKTADDLSHHLNIR